MAAPDVGRQAALDKTLTMERHVATLRAIVVFFNIGAYFVFLWPHTPRQGLALTVVVLAGLYALWSLLTRPYQRWPLLRFGAATLSSDVFLITLWVLATGGARSPFWVIYFVSVTSVAMRYDVEQTVVAAAAEAVVYTVAMALDGGLAPVEAAVRPAYIMVAGLAAGMLARLERASRDERVWFERLAREHAEMLEREREVVEQLTQVDRLKTEFVANAAHELRTPLTTLAGLASTLGHRWHELSETEIANAMASMRRQGDRARVLIENLLDLSALERGRLMLALTPVSLDTVVRNALETAPPPDHKEVVVRLGEGMRAIADPSRLEQVITNLLTNAYRYGGSRINLSTAREEATIIVTVADDGSGVPAEVTAHLFEPFGRGDNINGQPGSGLGLAISRRLVEAFGGEMWYEPRDPIGAVFAVRLRVA